MVSPLRSRSAAGRRLVLLAMLLLAASVLTALHLPEGPPLPSRLRAAGQGLAKRMAGWVQGPVRVGVQIGHLNAASHPDELKALRASTGGYAAGLFEVDVNEAVGLALARELDAAGVTVELLPAVVPPRYRADAFISLHADSSNDPGRRGYKSAVFLETRNPRDQLLKGHVDRAYLEGSGLPSDDLNVSGDMLQYYAFNPRFRHSLDRRTPALIVELGYLSHESDRELLERPDELASLLAQGLRSFLAERGRWPGE